MKEMPPCLCGRLECSSLIRTTGAVFLSEEQEKKAPYEHSFQILARFYSLQRAAAVVAGQRQPLSPGRRRVALGGAGRNNVFRTSSPFLFNIE